MKNNKGFTLVELLATIALIGALGIVVGFSVTNLLNSQKEKRYAEYQKTLEDAACVFAQNDNRTEGICDAFEPLCKIYFENLIEKGLIKKTLTNPMTDQTVAEDTKSYVQVSYTNGERKCEYKEVTTEEEK